MSRATGIEWTDATWNPIRGCSRVSEGCRHCYAETVANRFCGPGKPYEGLVRIGADGKGTGQWNGQIKFVEKRLLDPLRWKALHAADGEAYAVDGQTRPRRIFVNSMSDLFHEGVTDEMLDRIFAVMALCPQHTFQVLTKRPERMRAYLSAAGRSEDRIWGIAFVNALRGVAHVNPDSIRHREGRQWPLPNVWLGVSVENQKTADERIPLLLQTPAAVRFISAEPLLGPLDIAEWTLSDAGRVCRRELGGRDLPNLDWVIVGGESGPGARPMHPDWVRILRDQCAAAWPVKFFFKQWGEWVKYIDRDCEDPDWRRDYSRMKDSNSLAFLNLAGGSGFHGERLHVMQRVGKKAAGHLLDGVEYRQFPEVGA